MVSHEISVAPEMAKAGGIRYRAICSCGEFRSRPYSFPGYAERAGRDHKKTKHPG